MTSADETADADPYVEARGLHAGLSKHHRWIGGGGAIVLLALIAHNLAWLRVNRRTIPCRCEPLECSLIADTEAPAEASPRVEAPPILSWLSPDEWERPCGYFVCVLPRDSAQVAARNKHQLVRGREQLYYYLSERIPNATLTIPEWMVEVQWYLERVSRLRVEVSQTPLLVAPEHVQELRAAGVHRHWLRKNGKRKKLVWQELYLLLDVATTEYVFAESAKKGGPLFLLPKSRFDSAALTRGDEP